MSKEFFPVVTEKKARKIIDKGKDVVIIHTRDSCPVCDHFLPEVLKPVFAKDKYKDIQIYQMSEAMFWPVGQHPMVTSKISQDPGTRSAATCNFRTHFEIDWKWHLTTTDSLWLYRPKQSSLVKILDGLVRNPSKRFTFPRTFANHRR